MNLRIRNLALLVSLIVASLFLPFSYGCGLFGDGDEDGGSVAPADRAICQALDLATTQEFLDNGNSAVFAELDNDQDVFIFTSSNAGETFDGLNVVELTSATVEYDFEDGAVDPGDTGGFYARWKIIFVPYTGERFNQFQTATLDSLLAQFRTAVDRTEVVLSGPFLENDCEWGDTAEIGTQSLTYSDHPLYDWDFYPATDRILGILYEGDRGVGDDAITKLDVSKNAGTLVFEEAGKYRIEIESLSDVAINP